MMCIHVQLVGSTYAGRLSDKFIVSERKRRGGKWVPEDRLRSTLLGGIILAPGSVIVSGFITQFWSGTVPMLLNLFCLWLNGIGVSPDVLSGPVLQVLIIRIGGVPV